jgi:signal transduction histidine kinase
MKVHWRTGLYLLPVIVAGVALAGLCLFWAHRTTSAFAQVAAANRSLEAIQHLDSAAANYAHRVAQLLYEERDPQGDLRAARLEMERGFVRLAQEARDQVALASGGPETRTLLADVEQTRRMLELYHAIDLSAARAFVLKRDLRPDEALEIYRRDVDFRLTNELSTLLGDAIADAQQRRQTALAGFEGAREGARDVGYALVPGLAVAILVTWFLFARRAQLYRPELSATFEAHAEELREANRRLRETDRRRAQFLADVSHELRTPLTILRGEADVALLPSSTGKDRQRSLERIQAQAEDLAQLLDDLIAFARSDAGAEGLSLNPVLLDDLLAIAVEEGETLSEPREVTIALTLVDTGLWLDADGRKLKQALMIGLDNAINHSPPGSHIEVQLCRDGEEARLAIMDRGPGLQGAETERVFDRFYRGENATNSFGLGIGLAIAKGIVEQHLGTITLSDRAGGGAVLTVLLPLARGPGS